MWVDDSDLVVLNFSLGACSDKRDCRGGLLFASVVQRLRQND